MPKLVPVYAATVVRGDKHVNVMPGVPFDFTPEEVKEILAHNLDYLRKPVNESGDTIAKNITDASLRGKVLPQADDTRDANVLSVVPASEKVGGKKVRNQGGGLAESRVGTGQTNNNDEENNEPDAPADGADDL